jgi:hypothetical protein
MSESAGPHVEVDAYVLGKLEADEADASAAHLSGCADATARAGSCGACPNYWPGRRRPPRSQGARRRTLAGRGRPDQATVMRVGLGGRPTAARCWRADTRDRTRRPRRRVVACGLPGRPGDMPDTSCTPWRRAAWAGPSNRPQTTGRYRAGPNPQAEVLWTTWL